MQFQGMVWWPILVLCPHCNIIVIEQCIQIIDFIPLHCLQYRGKGGLSTSVMAGCATGGVLGLRGKILTTPMSI